MTEDLPLLIEGYKKEIWEWKQKESQWIRDKNQLDGNKRIIEELSAQMVEMGKKIREAEGETSLVKAIGINSPEMKAAQARVQRLDESLSNALEINESHQRYNSKLQIRLTEVEEDNKKLSKQIQDLNSRLSS
jgi:DNA repair exonuclease SbcCD ATPase subunit